MFLSIYDPQPQTKDNLGGKGFGLWQMAKAGVPVPPALIIPTTVCVDYMADPVATMKAVEKALPQVYEFFNERFGFMPLVSVRSGARVSMPGMMDTILNVGLDPSSENFWRERLGDDCAYNCMSRLVEMYGSVVHGIDRAVLTEGDLGHAMQVYAEKVGHPFPTAKEQLLGSIKAVFESWNNERAKYYRRMHDIPEEWGTAVVIQAMVFGNLNDKSATGVLFTRNPDTGENKVTGEYLVNAQGEDVVAGIRTPLPLAGMWQWNPNLYDELITTVRNLEKSARDVQDVEFTVEDGKLFILQTRNAKRTAAAAVRIAVEMEDEDFLTREEALKRVSKAEYFLANQKTLDPIMKAEPSFTGISACSGVAVGLAVTAADALNCKVPFILVGEETTPDDIAAMDKSQGVLTMKGGATSHAAVVARSMNRPCVVGVGANVAQFLGKQISIDGATGRVWFGAVPTIEGGGEWLKKFDALLFQGSVGIGFDTPCPTRLIDVTDLTLLGLYEEAAKVVQTAAETSEVIVTAKASSLTPMEGKFFGIFGCEADLSPLWKTMKLLPAGLKSKVSVMLNQGDLMPAGFKVTSTTDDLDTLLANSDPVFWNGAVTKGVQKAVAYKVGAGEKVIAVGVAVEGSTPVLSRSQAVALMLR